MYNLTGKRFGKLTVIKIDSRDKFKHLRWLCRCDCGKETVVLSDNLLRSHTTSCGCELSRISSKIHKKHGQSHTENGRASKAYTAWINMRNRCENPKNKRYENYGGRGIRVCDKWQVFEGFWNDMGATYKDGLTIDRIDVNGDYAPGNCKWATWKEQANNKRNNHYVFYNGERMTLKEACMKQGINYQAVSARLKLGWDFEKAIKTPIRPHK